MGSIFDFSPGQWVECNLATQCEKDWLGDWNRSSRPGQRGEFSADDGQLRTKLTLTSKCNFSCHYCHPERIRISDELQVEQWISGLSRLHDMFNVSFHGIQGTVGEPLLYRGVEEIVRHIVSMGDHVTFISNFSCNDKVLLDMVQTCDPDHLRFGASLHMTDKHFDMNSFCKRVYSVKQAGHYIEVLIVACPSQIYLHDRIVDLFGSEDIPVRAFYASCQPSTPNTRNAFNAMMSDSKSFKTVFS